jgi:hypothetical protein
MFIEFPEVILENDYYNVYNENRVEEIVYSLELSNLEKIKKILEEDLMSSDLKNDLKSELSRIFNKEQLYYYIKTNSLINQIIDNFHDDISSQSFINYKT